MARLVYRHVAVMLDAHFGKGGGCGWVAWPVRWRGQLGGSPDPVRWLETRPG